MEREDAEHHVTPKMMKKMLRISAVMATKMKLGVAADLDEMKFQVFEICQQFISAMQSSGDVSMQQIQVDWEKAARDAADCHIGVADEKLDKLKWGCVDPAEIRAWENRKIELANFKEICWWDEIELSPVY